MIETALWLKAIYFDSGVAQTPEQTFARAYDCMPGYRVLISSRLSDALSRLHVTTASSDHPHSAGRGAPAPSDSRCNGGDEEGLRVGLQQVIARLVATFSTIDRPSWCRRAKSLPL